MKYIKVTDYYPHEAVDVYTVADNIVKWRYANATEKERKNNNLNSPHRQEKS